MISIQRGEATSTGVGEATSIEGDEEAPIGEEDKIPAGPLEERSTGRGIATAGLLWTPRSSIPTGMISTSSRKSGVHRPGDHP